MEKLVSGNSKLDQLLEAIPGQWEFQVGPIIGILAQWRVVDSSLHNGDDY